MGPSIYKKNVISAVKFKKPIKKLLELQNKNFILKNKKLLELDLLLSFLYKKHVPLHRSPVPLQLKLSTKVCPLSINCLYNYKLN